MLERPSANIRKQEQSCCYYSQIHYSQRSFYLIIYLASGSEYFSVCEFGTLVLSTNGYYHDKHKWLSLMDNCNRVLLLLAFVRAHSPTCLCFCNDGRVWNMLYIN